MQQYTHRYVCSAAGQTVLHHSIFVRSAGIYIFFFFSNQPLSLSLWLGSLPGQWSLISFDFSSKLATTTYHRVLEHTIFRRSQEIVKFKIAEWSLKPPSRAGVIKRGWPFLYTLGCVIIVLSPLPPLFLLFRFSPSYLSLSLWVAGVFAFRDVRGAVGQRAK